MNPLRTLVESPAVTSTPVASFRESVKKRYERGIGQQHAKRKQKDAVFLSIIVPVYNERPNLRPLIQRIMKSMQGAEYGYELIFVDDRSNDRSAEMIRSFSASSPIRVLTKKGERGKAYSLIEGFQQAKGEVIAMIDADLQYPPEKIPDMVELMQEYDIVVGNRRIRRTSGLRTFLSRTYQRIFGHFVLGLKTDVQSGLKVFRADILHHVKMHPSAWGFDYQFLYHAKRLGYRIGQTDIVFEDRKYGQSHVNTILTAFELIVGSVTLRLSYLPKDILPFLFYPHISEYHTRGFTNTDDFLFLPDIVSTRKHFFRETVVLLVVSLLVIGAGIGLLSAVTGYSPLLILSGMLALVYLGLIVFKLRIVRAGMQRKPVSFKPDDIAAITDEELPIYTILIPLYKEAEVIPQIVTAMSRIDYPVDKLDIIITLEEYDHETIDAIAQAGMPAHFRTLILPDVKPKTKPKALNVAFLQTSGEFLVIYDAEIIPDPDQLKKAYLAFKKHPDIACFQTQLDHYNAEQNWITKLFNAEFSFHYDLFLPGIQKLGYVVPLSGHSTHFRRDVLEDIGAWDPYNLTEDCDMGIRLFRKGYKTEMMDSRSQEEATCSIGAWVAQRSRWMEGFVQTSIVHLRHPLRLKNELGGWSKLLAFLVLVPGSVVMNIINLFFWVLLGAWFVTQSTAIQQLFPGPVLYISIFSFAFGNFTFMFLNLLGSYKRERYSLVKYSLLSFFYWLMLAYASLRGCVHLIFKPHQWEKTKHGKHLLTPVYATIPVAS